MSVTEAASAFHVVYDPLLVIVSLLVAASGSYSALTIADQLRLHEKPLHARFWAFVGGATFGLGAWATQFVGMLAIGLPIPVTYAVTTIVMSLLPAVVAGIVCISVLCKSEVGAKHLLLAGMVIGTSIEVMHYLGVAAMHMNAVVRYDPARFSLSIAGTLGLACVSLSLIERLKKVAGPRGPIASVSTSLTLGLAVTGMYYMDTWAVSFAAEPVSSDSTRVLGAHSLDETAAAAAVVVIIITISASAVARRLDRLRYEAETSKRQLKATVASIPEGFLLLDADRKLVHWNRAFEAMQPHLGGSLGPGLPYDELII